VLENPFARSVEYPDGLPIAPGAFPGLGHAPLLYDDALEYYRLGRERLGPLFWSNLGFGSWVVTCVETEGFELLRSKAGSMAHLKRDAPVLLGESLLGQDGQTHQRMRSALNAPFSPRGLAATGIGTFIAQIMTDCFERWIQMRSITVLPETQTLTLNIIFRLLGINVSDLPAWGHKYRELNFSVYPFSPAWIPGSPMWRAVRARKWLDAQLLEIIQEERSRPNSGSFLSELTHSKDDQGQALGESELVDNLRLLTFAGHETTASVLAWMALLLAQKPDLWNGVCEEARQLERLPITPQELRACPFSDRPRLTGLRPELRARIDQPAAVGHP